MAAGRRTLLTAALGFTTLMWREPVPPVVVALSNWMNSWTGVGAVAVGMHRIGYDIELKQYPQASRVNFKMRDVNTVAGTAWEPTPWRAVQRAAWAVLRKAHDAKLRSS